MRVAGGLVEGASLVDAATGRAVRRLAGVPYGSAGRWRPPGPVEPWGGVRDATRFGPSAPQRTTGPLVEAVPGMAVGAQAEECLSLNVWSPEGGHGLPVLVWVHGGAFVIGSSSLPTYDATHLAALGDVVVVSCNYRLGALGFLCASDRDLAPNVALLDLVAALAWVRDNIAGLGGDPARVTVVGESAGAGCIRALLAMPAAAGLFHRAVLQSPGADVVRRPAAEALAASFAEQVAGDLRVAPTDVVLDAQDAAAAAHPGLGAMPWCPVVDGDVVPVAPPDAAVDGVDLLLGTTSEELRPYARAMVRVPAGKETKALRAALPPVLGHDCGDEAAAEALAAVAGADPETAWTRLLTDAMMRLPLLAWADDLARRTSVRTYSFEWAAPTVGAAHAVDLPFTFGTFDVDGWAGFVGADHDARRLSDALIRSWAAFARTGDPSTDDLGAWPEHRPGDTATMVLGRTAGWGDRPPTLARDALGGGRRDR